MTGNRAVFGKQKDFLMPLDRIRSVMLKGKKLNFTYNMMDGVFHRSYGEWLGERDHNICTLFFLLGKVMSYGSGERTACLPIAEVKGVTVCDNVFDDEKL